MQNSSRASHKNPLKQILSRQSRSSSKQAESDKQNNRQSQSTTGQQQQQQSSQAVFPEKRTKFKPTKQDEAATAGKEPKSKVVLEHKIDIGDEKPKEHKVEIVDEKSNLLGYNVFAGKLLLLKKSVNIDSQTGDATTKHDGVNAKLTSKALVWGSHMIFLEDVISVSYSFGLRYFTVHTYTSAKGSCGLPSLAKRRRSRKDFRFLASSYEDAVKWVTGLSDHNCFVKCAPHPMKQGADAIPTDPFFEQYIKSKTPPRVLVILNPRSGHGRSSKVFYGLVEPIFKLAGFEMDVINTKSAGHAKEIASTVEYNMCPDGIICVGGDGIVNEVLNGLLVRNDRAAISIPIGVIPAGSDNSLVWTILGVKDPVSAAITIVKGGLTPTDVFAVEWVQNGAIHFGSTVTYFGFVSDVLELSERYQKRFGPLRYFVAGFHKFLCMPKYAFEIEYLMKSEEVLDSDGKDNGFEDDKRDMSDLYADILRRSKKEGVLTRASSLSSIDSLMTPSRMSGDLDASGNTPANSEPSEYVRALDPRSKRLSLNRNNVTVEPDEVIYPQLSHSSTPNWPRTRSKSRMEKGWTGLTAVNDARTSWANAAACDKEDISSTISDPGPDRGPIWDPEPNTEPTWEEGENWETENPVQLPEPQEDLELGSKKDDVPSRDENWVTKKGRYLGILICNHSCRSVQSSQVVAPNAEHDDNTLDLILVRGSGRWRLARFFINMQFGKHVSLPYVEYVKVKSVKVKPGKICHNGCGIDGELFPVHGQVICSLHPDRCCLVGLPAKDPR